MTRLTRLPIALAFNIAAGLGTFLALADDGFAQALPPLMTVFFGAATGTTQAPGAAVYSVAVYGTPTAPTLVPTLVPTLLNPSPEPPISDYSFTPQVSALAFLNKTTSDLVASNSATVGDLYTLPTLPGPSYSTSRRLFTSIGTDFGAYATGLGVDGAGNILGAGNNNVGTSGPSVFIYEQSDGTNPVLMDLIPTDTHLVGGSTIQTIADAAVAPSAFPNLGIQAGDLLVLVADSFYRPGQLPNQPVVFDYPHPAIANGLIQGFPIPAAAATAVVTQSNFPVGMDNAAYYAPVSMAISPIDGSLLIATSDGTIWQLKATATGYQTPTIYALPPPASVGCFHVSVDDSCGLAWGKIGAMQQGGNLYVFATVADNGTTLSSGVETGHFEVFSGTMPTGGYTAPSASLPNAQYPWTSGVQPTSVVAGYKTGTVLASECFDPSNPCDIIGDRAFTLSIVQHVQSIPAGATITQQECVVPVDPRVDLYGNVTDHRQLPFKEVCPGLNDTRIIPSYAYGSPGFILFASLA